MGRKALLIFVIFWLFSLSAAISAFAYDEVIVEGGGMSAMISLGMTQQDLIASVGAPSRIKSEGRCLQYDAFDISVYLDEDMRVDRIYLGKNFSGQFAGNSGNTGGPGSASETQAPPVRRTYTPSPSLQSKSTLELEDGTHGGSTPGVPMEYRGEGALYQLSSNGDVIKSKYASDTEGVAYWMDKKGAVYATVIYPAGEMRAAVTTEAGPAAQLSLEPIYFDFDKHDIKHEYFAVLNQDAEYLRENAAVRVTVGGHTDAFGTGEYNMALSQRRAKSVYDFLAQKGIPGSRMKIAAYGMTRPIADNKTAEGRATNRRVELETGTSFQASPAARRSY